MMNSGASSGKGASNPSSAGVFATAVKDSSPSAAALTLAALLPGAYGKGAASSSVAGVAQRTPSSIPSTPLVTSYLSRPASKEDSEFDMRGVNLKLLQALATYARGKGGNWTCTRVSAEIVGVGVRSGYPTTTKGTFVETSAPSSSSSSRAAAASASYADALTSQDKTSLLDVLKLHHKDAGSGVHPLLHVGYDEVVGDRADIYVTFSSQSDFFELVGAIEAFVQGSPQYADSYFWLDMLVMNPWKAYNHDVHWFTKTLKNAIADIHHTLVLCLPWENPLPLRRAWCLWEINCSIDTGCKIDMALGPGAFDRLLPVFLSEPDEYCKVLVGVNIEKSECRNAADKQTIFRAVTMKDSIGVPALNTMTAGFVLAWLVGILDNQLKKLSAAAGGGSGAGSPPPLATRRDLRWDVLIAKAKVLINMGEHAAALQVCEDCLREFRPEAEAEAESESESTAHADGLRLACTYATAGLAHNHSSKYLESLGCLHKCLAVQLQSLGPDHENVATTYSNMGSIYRMRGENGKAFEAYSRVKEMRLRTMGELHPSVASAYSHLGGYYEQVGDYPNALQNYAKSVEIEKKLYGDSHVHLATSYSNIANVHRSQANWAAATEYFERAMVIEVEHFGAVHPFVAEVYKNIALSCYAQGSDAKALDFFRRSYDILAVTIGPKHSSMLTTLSNIASVYRRQGNHLKALEFFRIRLGHEIDMYGEQHTDVATTLCNMGGVFYSHGDHAKALEHYERSRAIDSKLLGGKDIKVGTTIGFIAGCHFTLGQVDKALEASRSCLEIQMASLGPAHPSVKETIACIKTCKERLAMAQTGAGAGAGRGSVPLLQGNKPRGR